MGVKERKQREKRGRTSAILKAAKWLIARQGVEGMSMNQLADRTELNKATLYAYFASKDDLIDAIVCEALGKLEEEFDRNDGSAATGLERVLNLTRTTFAFYRENPVYFYAMTHQERRSPGQARETPFAVMGDEIASRVFRHVEESVERGIADGSIREGIDVGRFQVLYFAHTYGVMHTVFAKEDVYADVLGLDPESVESAALELLEVYLKR
jgi:AcrR family transcriptional regulator